jgi:hypothetical protein
VIESVTCPQWLTSALDDAYLRVINVKGISADDIIVMVKLSQFEKLIASSGIGSE